jgi:hypothetical protein
VNQEFYRLQRRQSKGCEKKGMVVHTWNPSTLEADIRRKAHGPGPVQAKKKKNLQGSISRNGWVQWCVPVIQPCGEETMGVSLSRLTWA